VRGGFGEGEGEVAPDFNVDVEWENPPEDADIPAALPFFVPPRAPANFADVHGTQQAAQEEVYFVELD